jgi:hypothetical protein
MAEYDRTIGLDVIGEMHAAFDLPQQLGESGTAFLERRRPQIPAVQLEQVKRIQEHCVIVMSVAQQFE